MNPDFEVEHDEHGIILFQKNDLIEIEADKKQGSLVGKGIGSTTWSSSSSSCAASYGTEFICVSFAGKPVSVKSKGRSKPNFVPGPRELVWIRIADDQSYVNISYQERIRIKQAQDDDANHHNDDDGGEDDDEDDDDEDDDDEGDDDADVVDADNVEDSMANNSHTTTSMSQISSGSRAPVSAKPVSAKRRRPKKQRRPADSQAKKVKQEKREYWKPGDKVFNPETVRVVVSAGKRSDVWRSFREFDYTVQGQERAICENLRVCTHCLEEAKMDDRICFVVHVDGHNTSKMTNHLKKCHKPVVAEENKEAAVKHLSEGKSIQSFVTYGGSYMYKCMKWMVLGLRPINTVEDPLFRDMVQELNPKAPMVTRAKVGDMIASIAQVVMAVLVAALVGQFFALTTDHWTSAANVSYMATTAHYIDDQWELVALTLQCREHHGSAEATDILVELKKVFTSFNLLAAKCVAVVTDTAPVMGKFGRELKEKLGIYHVYCTDHQLELTTGLAFKVEDDTSNEDIMKMARKLVGHFTGSSQAEAQLLGAQESVVHPLKCIQDVVTRWWSTFQMVERLLKLRPTFEKMVGDGVLAQEDCLDDEQWETVGDVKTLLEPFMCVQKLLEGQKYVTISLVPYLINKVRNGLVGVVNTSRIEAVKHLARTMLNHEVNGLNTYWGSGRAGTVFDEHKTAGSRQRAKGFCYPMLIATAVDPRMKTLGSLGWSECDQVKVWEAVAIQMKIVQDEREQAKGPAAMVHARPVEALPSARPVPSSAMSMFSDLLVEWDSQQLGTSQTDSEVPALTTLDDLAAEIEEELQAYRDMSMLPMFDGPNGPLGDGAVATNPLVWWKAHARKFPLISTVAKRFLCIPATSAPAERVFSVAGLAISKLRSSLLPEFANDLIFLHDSWAIAEKIGNRGIGLF